MRTTIIIAALTLALGCGKKKPQSKPNLPAKPEPSNEVKKTFAEPKGNSTKHERFLWKFETGGPIDSSPAIGLNGNIYFGSQDNKVYALSSKTGQKIWDFETNGEVNSSPTVSPENIVLIGSMGGKFYALDGKSGKTIWDFSDTSGFYSSSAIADGKVYFGSAGGNFYVLDDGSSGDIVVIPSETKHEFWFVSSNGPWGLITVKPSGHIDWVDGQGNSGFIILF